MCSTGPFQFRWLREYIHSSCFYQPYPLSYFSVAVCLRCLLHHILSLIAYTFRENRDFVFIIIMQFVMSANSRIRFVLQIVLVCLYITPSHYHHFANISEEIELIKCLSDIFGHGLDSYAYCLLVISCFVYRLFVGDFISQYFST